MRGECVVRHNCAPKTAEFLNTQAEQGVDHMSQKSKRLAAVSPQAIAERSASSNPSLDRAIQARIGDKLRSMYDELLQQPVPDRFRDLLGQLEKRRETEEQSR